MKVFKVLFLILLCSCGGNESSDCLTREQVLTICLADKIKEDSREWRVEFFKNECSTEYPYEACYLNNIYIDK